MEIRDIIHGSIEIEALELPIIDSRFFQRLRQIKQLGFAEFAFPSATHNRFIHSLGAMHTATQVFDSIFKGRLSKKAYSRFRCIVRLGALLHDVGHGPLSHTTEFAMPDVRKLQLFSFSQDPKFNSKRQATHEDYTLKIVLDSDLTPLIDQAGKPWGFKSLHVAALIDPKIKINDHFFFDTLEESQIHFRPILEQIISSELDADRMDYLRRDCLHAGVSYGHFDFDWIAANLTYHIEKKQCYLSLQHRALYAFEDFLISRYHMFLMVYFHHKCVIFDSLLAHYLSSPDCTYHLPAEINAYCETNDAQLYNHLAHSPHPFAQRISQKRPYQVLIELHSGIPASKSAQMENKKLLIEVQQDLKSKNIHSILAKSTSEFSKYFGQMGHPIFVSYDNHYSTAQAIPLEQCTDLFQKYGEKRSITRIYVSPEDYPHARLGPR